MIIVLSTIKLVIDTYTQSLKDETNNKNWSTIFDDILTICFLFEAVLKAIVFGVIMDKYSYLRGFWNILDFFIISTSLIDMLLINVNTAGLKIFRLLRILRPLRFISRNSLLKKIVVTLFDSIGPIFNITIILLVVWLMFAILGVSFYNGKLFYCSINPYINLT